MMQDTTDVLWSIEMGGRADGVWCTVPMFGYNSAWPGGVPVYGTAWHNLLCNELDINILVA